VEIITSIFGAVAEDALLKSGCVES